jgi:hypothetical protein
MQTGTIKVALVAALLGTVEASTIFQGGTIRAFDKETQGLKVICNGSVLKENDRITGVFESAPNNIHIPTDA